MPINLYVLTIYAYKFPICLTFYLLLNLFANLLVLSSSDISRKLVWRIKNSQGDRLISSSINTNSNFPISTNCSGN